MKSYTILAKTFLLLILICFIPVLSISGQAEEFGTDTVIRHHSARTAMLLSAVIPGMGQIYNNKIWKIPILYGGAGATIYLYNYWNDRYKVVLRYLDSEYEGPFTIYGRGPYAKDRLPYARDKFRRWRDLNLFITSGIYLINIIDAAVDAYLFEYDISDDLSMTIEPSYIPSDMAVGGMGLSLRITF